MGHDIEIWSVPKDSGADDKLGWTMLQTLHHRAEKTTGVEPGTLERAGIANTYYSLDTTSGPGGMISAQFLPFAEEKMLKLGDELYRTGSLERREGGQQGLI
ncbi:hypothetical protein JCM11641_005056 [Rhodosporidiobolus odoratus]